MANEEWESVMKETKRTVEPTSNMQSNVMFM
jgi:hypothetical protein